MLSKLQSWLTSYLMPRPYIESNLVLSGKVVLVTGSSRGIGLATSDLLEKRGALIVRMNSTVDIVDASAIQTFVDKAIKQHGKIDAVINCAGVFIDKQLDKTTPAEFTKVLAVNVTGSFNIAHAIVPYMKKAGKGLIINLGSKISHNTNISPNKVTYATSKYAVEGFSFALNTGIG